MPHGNDTRGPGRSKERAAMAFTGADHTSPPQTMITEALTHEARVPPGVDPAVRQCSGRTAHV